jgi:hypothetical protein
MCRVSPPLGAHRPAHGGSLELANSSLEVANGSLELANRSDGRGAQARVTLPR